MAADRPVPEIDAPAVVDEVTAAFERYEAALLVNDLPTLNELFWDDPRTVRIGIAECLYGYDAIERWRNEADPVPVTRQIVRTSVTTVGQDVAMVDCEFRNGDEPELGRQSQVWLRRPEGWRIVRAHVSMLS